MPSLVVAPLAHHTRRRRATYDTPQLVVVQRQRAAVDRLRPQEAGPITHPGQCCVWPTSSDQLVEDVVLIGRHHAVGVLASKLANGGVGVIDRLADRVGPGRQLARSVVGVVQRPAVEVGLGNEPTTGVVGVGPAEASRIGDPAQPQLDVMLELVARSVWAGSSPQTVECAVLVHRPPAAGRGVVSTLPSPSYVHSCTPPSGSVRRSRRPSVLHDRRVTRPRGSLITTGRPKASYVWRVVPRTVWWPRPPDRRHCTASRWCVRPDSSWMRRGHGRHR